MNDQRVDVGIGILIHHHHPDGRWEVLIARRAHELVLGGYWEFPGGKVEADETPDQCVVREFQEEVALEVRVTRSLPTIDHTYPHGSVRLHPFLCGLTRPEDRPNESERVRWVPIDQLDRYRFPPANRELLDQLESAFGSVNQASARGDLDEPADAP